MKKTYIITLLTAFMGFAQGAWADDIHITSISELETVSANVADGTSYSGVVIYLDNDLTFDGTENNFTPIGSMSGVSNHFDGTFDGQGHTISGLNLSGESRQALFALVTGTVRNLKVSNSSFSCSKASPCAGIVAALRGGTVENCHVTDDVHVKKCSTGSMGGIVGRSYSGSVIGCTSAAILGENNESSDSSIGGILGLSEHNEGDVAVQNCLYYGNSMNTTARNGAIVGFITRSATYSTTLEQNFYCTAQSGIKGIGYYEKSPNNLSDVDEITYHGAVCAHIVSASDDDIADMGKAKSPLAYSGITPYDYGVEYGGVYYSHVLALENSGDYSGEALAAYEGCTFDVKLRGRTFYRDGDWNTMCLPFDITDFTDTMFEGEGREIRELDIERGYYLDGIQDVLHYRHTGYRTEDHKLYLFFKATTRVYAGTPYIVKWTRPVGYDPNDPATYDYPNPIFRNVTINSTLNPVTSDERYGGGAVTFTPTYGPVVRDYQDRTLLLLGASNTLYYPYGNGTATVKPFRAYFQLNNGLQMAAEEGSDADDDFVPEGGGDVKAFVLDLEGGADGIRELTPINEAEGSKMYNLAGQRLSRLQKGLNIVNGKKVLVK